MQTRLPMFSSFLFQISFHVLGTAGCKKRVSILYCIRGGTREAFNDKCGWGYVYSGLNKQKEEKKGMK